MPSGGNSRDFWEGSSPDEDAVAVFTRRFVVAKTEDAPEFPDLTERFDRIDREIERGFRHFEWVSVRFVWASFIVGVLSGMVLISHHL